MNIKTKEIFYISNLLSLLRVFIGIPIFYFLSKTDDFSFVFVAVLGFIAIISDYFDGFFSRKFNQVTELGKIIDPIADKICGIFVLLGLIVYRGYPAGVLFLLTYRDILILVFGLIISKKHGKVVSSIFLGKLNTSIIGLSAFLYVLKFNHIVNYILIIACYLIIIISGIAYFKIGDKLLSSDKTKRSFLRSAVAVLSVAVIIIFIYLSFNYTNFFVNKL
ncbi:MAG: CDP-alcohol phosphatidyltransferase family protein [bacterium]